MIVLDVNFFCCPMLCCSLVAGETGLVGTAMYVSPELLKQDVRYTQVSVYVTVYGSNNIL